MEPSRPPWDDNHRHGGSSSSPSIVRQQPSTHALNALPLLPLLEAHPHPSFLIALSAVSSVKVLPVWANHAGRSSSSVVDSTLLDTLDALDRVKLSTRIVELSRQLEIDEVWDVVDSASTSTPSAPFFTTNSFFEPEEPTIVKVSVKTRSFSNMSIYTPASISRVAYEVLLVPFSTDVLSHKTPDYLLLQLLPTSSSHNTSRRDRNQHEHLSDPSNPMADLTLGKAPPALAPQEQQQEVPPGEQKSQKGPSVVDGDMGNPVEPDDKEQIHNAGDEERFISTAELLETYDWASTSLGPREEWPQSLVTACSIVQNTGHDSTLWWGPEFVLIYNDAYARMLGKKHPASFGKAAEIGWWEIWPSLKPLARQIIESGVSMHKFDDIQFFEREVTTALEETYHTWDWIPVTVEDGSFGGLLNASVETTSKVIAERRFTLLKRLAEATFATTHVAEYAQAVLQTLATEPKDIPFAMLWHGLLDPARKESIQLDLSGVIGAPNDHPSVPSTVFLRLNAAGEPEIDEFKRGNLSIGGRRILGSAGTAIESAGGGGRFSPGSSAGVGVTTTTLPLGPGSFDGATTKSSSSEGGTFTSWEESCPWPLAKALLTGQPVFVPDCRKHLVGFEVRGWDVQAESAVVIPLANAEQGSTSRAVLVVGLNVRRPLDKEYKEWLQLLQAQLAAGLTKTLSVEFQLLKAAELARMDEAKTVFFSNAAHELRTPLTLIKGPLTDLLNQETENSSRRRLLGLAKRNTDRLVRLVNALMDVSRVEAGRMKGNFAPVQLSIFTAHLASLFRSSIENGGLTYEVDCSQDPQLVYVDPDMWEKIVFNLIGNSLKYTLKGSIAVSIKFFDEYAEFLVQDTGIGIPIADQPLVVERFHRVASVGRSHEGAGIGLSLTFDLIKAHKGLLVLESRTVEESDDGQSGSNFFVRIPLGFSHLPPDRITESPAEMSSKATSSGYAHGIIEEAALWMRNEDDSTPISESGSISQSESDVSSRIDPSTLFWQKSDIILVVDDNPDMRRYLVSLLNPYCEVVEAGNGLEALEAAQRRQPDLIITDYMMPKMDGKRLLAELRAMPSELALVPVLLITARAEEDEKVASLLLGAEDYLAKPFSARELVARSHLQVQLGKRRLLLERKFSEKTRELQAEMARTEVKRREAEEQRRHQQLLIDVVSHEYRNPVSAILQCASLAKENMTTLLEDIQRSRDRSESSLLQGLTEEAIQTLAEDVNAMDSILTMARSQETIANDILSLARIQQSTLQVYPVDSKIVQEAKNIVSLFRSECRMKSINLSFSLGPALQRLADPDQTVFRIDPVRFSQLLMNLTTNAVRFTSQSPVRTIEVSIDIRKDRPTDGSCSAGPLDNHHLVPGEDIYLFGVVRDSGPGLSPEELSRLFQRFQQANAKTHAVFGGSGLGLYICRSICDLMHGRIEVASRRGEGSTFRFFVRTELAADDAEKSRALSPDTSHNLHDNHENLALHVLIVEDSIINQKVLNRQLVKAGFQCDVADNGQVALDRIKELNKLGKRYDQILLDLEMPVMDGLTCIKTIREMEANGELPQRNTVFALTGNARQGQIDHALSSGMDDVILKPYKLDALLEKIRAFRSFEL